MGLRNTIVAYGSVSKFFHWLIFLLILFMIIYGYCLSYVPKDYQPFAYNIHKLTGLSILVLMLLRLLWALANPKPLLPPDTPQWQQWIERLVHFLLYATIIAMPLAGWIGSVAGGRPPHLGSFSITLPIAKNEALADTAFSIHNTIAVVIIVLVSLHILAALYHHFIKKDNTLRRMMPQGSHH